MQGTKSSCLLGTPWDNSTYAHESLAFSCLPPSSTSFCWFLLRICSWNLQGCVSRSCWPWVVMCADPCHLVPSGLFFVIVWFTEIPGVLIFHVLFLAASTLLWTLLHIWVSPERRGRGCAVKQLWNHHESDVQSKPCCPTHPALAAAVPQGSESSYQRQGEIWTFPQSPCFRDHLSLLCWVSGVYTPSRTHLWNHPIGVFSSSWGFILQRSHLSAGW